mgnify:CR=1 FL=1
MKRPVLGICGLLLVSLTAHADRVYLEGHATTDSDDAGHYRLFGGYRMEIPELGKLELDGAAGTRHYREEITDSAAPSGNRTTTERESFEAARLKLHGEATRSWRYSMRLEQLLGDDWDVLLGAATVAARPHADWYLELFAERELVDTVRAIRRHIRVDTYGLSLDYQLHPSWLLVGGLFEQDFSDGNRRLGTVERLIYSPQKIEWLHIQLKGKQLNADRDSDTYFSPERLQEYFLLIGAATPFADDNWVIRLLGGPGVQIIEPFASEREEKEAYLAELKLRGWFTDNITLESRLGCSSAVASTDSYSYCYGHLHLGYAW